MVIGVLQFELFIPGSRSLKDKRRVVKSLKDRLHREHMVSVAEIAALDHHRVALMGLVVVSNSTVYVNALLDRVIAKINAVHDARLGDVRREILDADHLPTEDREELWTEAERRDGGEA
ncbi:MAG: DUF503 domain-containing protein [Phycisphaerales bacterium]|nr:DUF503 domain-containing protein [Phycisphaerales bacterium]